MKNQPLLFLAALGLLAWSGCASMDLEPPAGDPHRVLSGTVNFREEVNLPADAKLMVRVVDASNPSLPPQVLGDREILNPGAPPIAFRVEYRADDALLRHGVNVEARISYGGKVHFYNLNQYAVSARNFADPREIWVNLAIR